MEMVHRVLAIGVALHDVLQLCSVFSLSCDVEFMHRHFTLLGQVLYN